jgi:hypothetical protein
MSIPKYTPKYTALEFCYKEGKWRIDVSGNGGKVKL